MKQSPLSARGERGLSSSPPRSERCEQVSQEALLVPFATPAATPQGFDNGEGIVAPFAVYSTSRKAILIGEMGMSLAHMEGSMGGAFVPFVHCLPLSGFGSPPSLPLLSACLDCPCNLAHCISTSANSSSFEITRPLALRVGVGYSDDLSSSFPDSESSPTPSFHNPCGRIFCNQTSIAPPVADRLKNAVAPMTRPMPATTRSVSGTWNATAETKALSTMEMPTANVFRMLSAYLRAIDTAMPPTALRHTATQTTSLKPTISPPSSNAR
mmetsp:Transcript_9345/g.28331  ORF Transcript_9345/g.28331 Transcript_9345/m.28331 type:complete len:269 (-) Transcript_9345:767-1573(-)